MRDGEPHRDGKAAAHLGPSFRDRPQGPEQGCAQDEREAKPPSRWRPGSDFSLLLAASQSLDSKKRGLCHSNAPVIASRLKFRADSDWKTETTHFLVQRLLSSAQRPPLFAHTRTRGTDLIRSSVAP
jgi:hypothetical protein